MRRAAHRPSRQTTDAAGWHASSAPRCDRRTDRADTFDAIFHVAAGAVDLLVEPLRRGVLAAQRGDDKARIGHAGGPLGLATTRRWRLQLSRVDHWNSLNRPRRLAAGFALLLGRGELAAISPTRRSCRARPNRKS